MIYEEGLEKAKACQRLKIENEYNCDKEVNNWDCRDCRYFFRDLDNNIPRCLKKCIRDWCLYRIDMEE